MAGILWACGSLLLVGVLCALFNRSAIFRETLRLIWAEPIGILVPTLVAVVVLGTEQMADMIAGLRDSPWGSIAYGAAAAALGLSAWHWMRAVVDVEAGVIGFAARTESAAEAPARAWAIAIAPRLALVPAALVALAPLPDAVATVLASTSSWRELKPEQLWLMLGAFAPAALMMLLAFLFVWQRARLVRLFGRWLPQRHLPAPRQPPRSLFGWLADKPHYLWCLLCATPFGWLAGLVFLALVPGAMLLVAWWPPAVARISTGPVAALLALATLIPALVLLLACLRRLLWPLPGARMMGLALLASFLGGDWLPDDTYAVRRIRPSAAAPGPEQRPDLYTAMTRWMAACAPDASLEAPQPVLIVAAQGGASRGALWLLSVLRQLDLRTEGEMSRRLFGISAVSGGGLGAATYLQMVREARERPDAARCAGPDWLAEDKPHARVLQTLGEEDFLAPTLATYFLADILRRLPGTERLSRVLGTHVPTRAVRLELAFEDFWQKLPDPRHARAGLLNLRPPENPGLPHLVFTGTEVASGRRMLTATFRIGSNAAGEDDTARRLATPAFDDVEDILTILGADVPLATAVTNTARFPYVSPPGQFQVMRGNWSSERRQVVDGGYYESYGVTAAHEMAMAIERLSGRKLMPVVLIISNDADQDEIQLQANAVSCTQHSVQALTLDRLRERSRRDGGRVPEGLAPILGFLATRGAHARAALLNLHADQCPGQLVAMEDLSVRPLPPGRMAHFTLRAPVPPLESAPLNWVLNSAARDFMLNPAAGFNTAFNRQEMATFCRLMPCTPQ